jgi:hypothetical protein
MDDFTREFTRKVDEAAKAEAREVRAGEGVRLAALETCVRLQQRVEQRFAEVAGASGGRVVFNTVPGTAGGRFHVLEWHASTPRRKLLVAVDPDKGTFNWYLGLRERSAPFAGADPQTVTNDGIDRLILTLADQETWGKGEVPAVVL